MVSAAYSRSPEETAACDSSHAEKGERWPWAGQGAATSSSRGTAANGTDAAVLESAALSLRGRGQAPAGRRRVQLLTRVYVAAGELGGEQARHLPSPVPVDHVGQMPHHVHRVHTDESDSVNRQPRRAPLESQADSAAVSRWSTSNFVTRAGVTRVGARHTGVSPGMSLMSASVSCDVSVPGGGSAGGASNGPAPLRLCGSPSAVVSDNGRAQRTPHDWAGSSAVRSQSPASTAIDHRWQRTQPTRGRGATPWRRRRKRRPHCPGRAGDTRETGAEPCPRVAR